MNGSNGQPILITGVQRSGATLITRIMDLCGVYTGVINEMYENVQLTRLSKQLIEQESTSFPFAEIKGIPLDWKDKVLKGVAGKGKKWVFKSALNTQLWQAWNYAFPNAKWVIVRRRSADIINSCEKTAFMDLFSTQESLKAIGVETEKEAWLWWIHQYEKTWVDMISAGLNVKVIWPERMVVGDYGQIYELLEWLGLKWSTKIITTIDPLLKKSRR